MNRRFFGRSAAWLVVLAGAGLVHAQTAITVPGFEGLAQAYPGVREVSGGPGMHAVYGVPMTAGATAEEAAEAFLAQHASALGVENPTLVPDWSCDVNFGKFTVFQYRQRIDGLPVEYGIATVLVHNGLNRVVYASGILAERPAVMTDGSGVDPQAAMAAIARMPAYRAAGITSWKAPELVVFFGEDVKGPSVVAWKLQGENPDVHNHDAYSFFVNAVTGDLVHVRRDVVFEDVKGTVTGLATPGHFPDMASNPPQEFPISEAHVQHVGGGSAFTDVDGKFLIPFGGTGAVSVTSSLNDGRWVDVNDQSGTAILGAGGAGNAGSEIAVKYNQSPSEFTTAQVNVARHVPIIHNYTTDRAPGFTALQKITGNVNLNQTCNAHYSSASQSINFYRQGGGCNNTAYAGVIAHEYGHYMVNRRGLSQGSFGEGFGDTVAELIYDHKELGQYFQVGNPSPIRDPIATPINYSCSSGIHTCGMTLSGVWWLIKEGFEAKYGKTLGLELTRQLQVDWYLMTSGGSGNDSAHPQTAVEVLTVDDDDGNINNGTPNYNEICAAFSARNIPCPTLSLVSFTYPSGRPDVLAPGQPTEIIVQVDPIAATPTPGTGTIHYSVAGGPFQSAAMVETQPNLYTATIPAQTCGDSVSYYFRVETSSIPATDPPDAPASSFAAISAFGVEVALEDDFETDKGWTTEILGATTGWWERGVPVNDPNWQYDPISDGDGSGRCFVTQNQLGNTDVDNGSVRLTSPAFDLSGGVDAIRYKYYLYLTSPNPDRLLVEISSNGTAGPWKTIADHMVNGNTTWRDHEITGAQLQALGVTFTSNMRLRFTANDDNPQSINEAGVDGIEILRIVCDPPCYPDCDGNSVLDLFDFLCFTNAFNAGQPYADCDGNATLDLFDFLCFTNAFNAGCP